MIELLFKQAEKAKRDAFRDITVQASMLELYLDQVEDLGKAAEAFRAGGAARPPSRPTSARTRPSSASRGSRPSSAKSRGSDGDGAKHLDIMEDAKGQTYVKDLTYFPVEGKDEAMAILNAGIAVRRTAATPLNDVSSRSHTVFTITVVQKVKGDADESKTMQSHLNLVDLAGSERLKKSESTGDRLNEARFINGSLSTLGKVVLELSKGDPGTHIPYRDSKLTRVLKDSLGGNSYTTLLATINPTEDNYEECLNSLHFALRCKMIQTTPKINIMDQGDQRQMEVMIAKLRAQVADLQKHLEATHTHYQKVLEELAGPGFMKTLGPVEREGGAAHEEVPAALAGGRPPSQGGMRPPSSAGGPSAMARPGIAAQISPEAGGPSYMAQVAGQRVKEYERQLKEKQDALLALQQQLIEADNRHRAEQKSLREQHKKEAQRQASQQRLAANRAIEVKADHQKEVDKVKEINGNLAAQLDALTKSIPGRIDASKKERISESKRLEQLQEQLEAKRREEVRGMEERHQTQLQNLKEQSNFFLKKQKGELDRFAREFKAYKASQEGDREEMNQELGLLYEYCRKLTLIVEKMESGRYKMRERSGLKAFVIPAKDKPEALNLQATKHLRARLAQLENFAADVHEEDDPAELMESLPSRPMSARSARSTRSSTHVAVEELEMEVVALRRELQEARAQNKEAVLTAEKETLERQVLEELAGNETVEYIRRLETEVSQYQQNLQDERKRVSELKISLQSAVRQGGKANPKRAQSARPFARRSGGSRGVTSGYTGLLPAEAYTIPRRPHSTVQ